MRSFGSYTVTQRLAREPSGVAYRAHDASGCPAVIQTLAAVPLSPQQQRSIVQRADELRLCIRHPYVAQMRGAGTQDGALYIIHEDIEGQPLSTYLASLHAQHTTMPLETVVRVLDILTDALDFLHAQDIVHGNLHSGVVIWTDTEEVVLRDVALLPLLLDAIGQENAAEMRVQLGTPAYLRSPLVDSLTDPKARDLYGLAVILCEMLTGQVPFTSAVVEGSRAQQQSELSLPEHAMAHLPPRLATFLREVLNGRSVHQTAGNMAHSFRAIVEGEHRTNKPAAPLAATQNQAPSLPVSSTSTPAQEPPQRRHIGRYVIEAELGRGAMGIVYLAHDPYVNRYVAVKILNQELSTNTHFSDLFRREAQLVAALDHPHIVRVYDFGEHEGQLFIVMHYLAGGTLADRFRIGPMALRELVPIVQQVAQALDAAHAHGIIHRDVKPGNILFNTHGEAVLSDFGVAVLPKSAGTGGEHDIAGTPYYMSPEQARVLQLDAGQEPDERSDIYSLGVVLYEGLVGHVPFKGTKHYDTMLAHVMQPVPRIREQRADLYPGCQEVIDRVMAKDPADRYPTAREFARDLKELVSGRWFLRKLT